MKKNFLLFSLPFFIYFSYFYVKPYDTDYHYPLRTEVEYLDLDKKTEFTKSKLIVYKDGTLKLDFFVENRQKLDAKAYISLNNREKSTLVLKNNRHTVHIVKVKRGDYLQIDVEKTFFKKDDKVALKLLYRVHYQYYQEILIVLFWIFFAVTALKKSFFTNFLLVYIVYLFILYSEQIAFGTLSLHTNLAYIFLSLFLFGAAAFIQSKTKNRALRIVSVFMLYFIFLMPFVMSDLYCSSTSSLINKQVVDALLQTNVEEAKAYIKDFMDMELFVSFFLFIVFLFYLTAKADKEKVALKGTEYVFFNAVLLFLLFDYRAMHLYGLVIATLSDFSNQELKYKKLAQNRVADLKNLYSVKKEKGETYIVVIGESENKHHMSLYGYLRETTPFLSHEKGIVKFINAFSTQVYTTGVLSKALTESDGFNKIDYLHAYSIVEIAKKAGFETYWLTNQVLKGAWDNVISVVANESDKVIGLNKGIGRTVETSVYDAALVPYLKKILAKKSERNRLIFIHLMGNHNRYADRYPKKFDRYQDYLDKKEFGDIVEKEGITQRLNSYDNSVLYNDYVLHKIISTFKDANATGALLYFSDHSEDVVNNLAHNPNKFTYAMCEIPFLVFPTRSYIRKYPHTYESLLKNRDKLFNNAFVYDSIIGITGIKTKKFNPAHSVASDSYRLDENESYTLDGKQLYTSAENFYYHKQKNIRDAIRQKRHISLDGFPDFLELYEDYRYGIDTLDLRLKEEKKGLYIANSRYHISLTEFLRFTKRKKMHLFLNLYFEDVKDIKKSMRTVFKDFGKNVRIYLSLKNIKRLPPKFAYIDNIGLQLDSERIYRAITQMSGEVEKLAEIYRKTLMKYRIKSIAFDEKIIQFVYRYGLHKNVDVLVISTSQNICSARFKIQKNKFKAKKVIYEIKYCTMKDAVQR